MLRCGMNLYYVYLESRIFIFSSVFSLTLCVVFILSLYLCYSVYSLVTIKAVLIMTIGYQLDEQ